MPSIGATTSTRPPVGGKQAAPLAERFENLSLAATVLGWTVWDLYRCWRRWQDALVAIACIKLLVGGLLIVREPLRKRGSWFAWMAAAPSLLIAYAAFRLSVPPDQWPWWCAALLLIGCGVTLSALFTLGASFSVFPAVRTIVGGGLYRHVRHPAYLGQLILVAACCLASRTWWGALPLALGVPLVATRIYAEEQLLMSAPEYVAYARAVRWRLVPWLW